MFSISGNNDFYVNGRSDLWKSTNEMKFNSPYVDIRDYASSATAGILIVATVTTASGGLTLDSAGDIELEVGATTNYVQTKSNNSLKELAILELRFGFSMR